MAVDGSRKVRVVKQGGETEAFDPAKLAAAIYRAMQPGAGNFARAGHIAMAVGLYLRQVAPGRVAGETIFEMTVRTLRCVGLEDAAGRLEAHRRRRAGARGRLRVVHEGGQATRWEKAWLAELARRGWFLGRETARILAGQVEEELLASRRRVVGREEVLEILNRHVSAYGLADAVPVAT